VDVSDQTREALVAGLAQVGLGTHPFGVALGAVAGIVVGDWIAGSPAFELISGPSIVIIGSHVPDRAASQL
jgi:hypothetical protein